MSTRKDYNSILWEDILYYDETSPTFLRWKTEIRRGLNYRIVVARVGDIAGAIDKKGYSRTKLHGKSYENHRIIWVLFYGAIDINLCVDHIDGDRYNNRIGNLRLTTHAINMRNQSIYSNNKSGVNGVHRTKTGYYVAEWGDINGKRKQKSFSISKFGEQDAFTMACEYREQKICELNSQGAGYTNRHGKELELAYD